MDHNIFTCPQCVGRANHDDFLKLLQGGRQAATEGKGTPVVF
jgi:hypothetical protein